MARKKEKNYRVEISDYPSWFLPSPIHCANLLRIPTSAQGFLNFFYKYENGILKKDDLYDFENEGVGKKRFERIKDFSQQLLPEAQLVLSEARFMKKTMRLQSNAGIWASILAGYRKVPNVNLDDPLLKFIQRRIDNDIKLRESYIQLEIESKTHEQQGAFLAPFLFENTLVDRDLISSYLALLTSLDISVSRISLTNKDLITACRFNAYIHADFYFSAFARIEVNSSQYFYHDSKKQTIKILLIEIIKDAHSKKCETYFEALLDKLRIELGSATKKRPTWRALESLISVSVVEDEIGKDPEKQRGQCNEWRRGGFPSKSNLKLFSAKLCSKVPAWRAAVIYEIASQTISLDKLRDDLKQHVKDLDKSTGEKILNEAFDHYQHHWNFCREKYLTSQ